MRFQIHLSTAIALMFTAGAIMWLNLQGRHGIVHGNQRAEPREETSEDLPGDSIYENYGWPFKAASRLVGTVASLDEDGAELVVLKSNSPTVMMYTIPCPL